MNDVSGRESAAFFHPHRRTWVGQEHSDRRAGASWLRAILGSGRGIIQDQVAIGGRALPWNDPAVFAEHMLTWEMRSYHIAEQSAGRVFFDRGVPDVAGHLRLMKLPVPEHVEKL